MIVRKEQMDVLAVHSLAMANQRLAQYARKRFPHICAKRTEEEMLRFVETVRSSAQQHGFERDDHVATWLDLILMYGLEFPESAWASPILKNQELALDGKMEGLKKEARKSGGEL